MKMTGSAFRMISSHQWLRIWWIGWVIRFLSVLFFHLVVLVLAPRWLSGQESTCHTGDMGSISGLGGSPGEEMATHSSLLAGRIPWREEPGRLTVHEVTQSQTWQVTACNVRAHSQRLWCGFDIHFRQCNYKRKGSQNSECFNMEFVPNMANISIKLCSHAEITAILNPLELEIWGPLSALH